MDRSRHNSWLLGALLVLAVMVAYGPAWSAGFIWDDDFYVTQNPLLTASDGLSRIWFSTDAPSQYFPLVYTTFRAEHALWGFAPAGFHAVNILLHAMNALLVWTLLRRLAVPGAWCAAAIFALHPVQVESVAWVTELKNVQSLFFSLLTLLAWLEFTTRERRWGWYGVAVACHALALCSKTTACTIPAAMLLVLWLQRRPITLARWVQVTPFVLMGLGMGFVSMWWERQFQGTIGAGYTLAPLDRVLVAARALWFYVGKLLWPADLTFNYPLWSIDRTSVAAYGWVALTAAATIAVGLARRRSGRGLETGLLFFATTLSPLLGFVMLYTFCYTYVADHYQYVAMIGVVALVVATATRAVERFSLRSWVGPAVAAGLVLLLGGLTWHQSRMYHDLETLWRVTLQRNPASSMAHNNLGAILLARGETAAAIPHFERALALRPGHVNALYNLGRARAKAGDLEAAIAAFEQAVAQEPSDAKLHCDLGLALLRAGRADEAVQQERTAVRLQPNSFDALLNLGAALVEAGRLEEGVPYFRRAVDLQPQSADAAYNLGTALVRLGAMTEGIFYLRATIAADARRADAQHNLALALRQTGANEEALGFLTQAVALVDRQPEYRVSLGWALLDARRPAEALPHFEAALRFAPDRADAQYGLGVAQFQAGRIPEAIATFQRLAEKQPDNPELRNNLGWALLKTGRLDEAITEFQAAVRLQPQVAPAHSNLAMALFQKGRVNDAITEYRAMLALVPSNAASPSDLAGRTDAQLAELLRRQWTSPTPEL